MPSNLIIGSSSEISDEAPQLRAHYKDFSGGGVSEIEEEEEESPGSALGARGEGFKVSLATIREEAAGRPSTTSSFDLGEDVVYVAVSKQGGGDEYQASMGALMWALKNAAINPSSVVFLVHVFPETKYIPTPLGNLPISQVNATQKEIYMAQETSKRSEFLRKFIKVCSDSQVKVDTILIESEMEAKAILDLIPILNIRKLVLGATKSTVRRIRSKKGNGGVADQILQGAPEFCEVKIIWEGKEMCELVTTASPSPSPSPRSTSDSFGHGQDEQTRIDSAACGCFKL